MKNASAFTLLELMITLAIVGVLVAAAVPSFTESLQNSAMTTNTNKLIGALQITRSEAIKRGSRVTLCQSSNSTGSLPTCTSGTGWEEGWIVFADTDSNNSYDSGEELILVSEGADENGLTIRGTAMIASEASFIGSGFPESTAGSNYTGTFRVCDSRGLTTLSDGVSSDARAVVIFTSGRIRYTSKVATISSCP